MVFRSNNFVNELGGKLHSPQAWWKNTCQHWETLGWGGLEASSNETHSIIKGNVQFSRMLTSTSSGN